MSSEGFPNENYIGFTAGKTKFDGNNSNSINQYIKGTTLSKYIWKLKGKGGNFEIGWKVIFGMYLMLCSRKGPGKLKV